MAVIKVQKIPKTVRTITSEDLLALFCYHFQQYTYAEAKKLPRRRIMKMLRIADREYAKKMYDLLQITASQHTKKLAGIKQLSDHYKSILEN